MHSALQRLTQQLHECWPLYLEAQKAHPSGDCSPGSSPDFSGAVTERDADGFLRGLDGRLYWVERGHVLQSELMPRKKAGGLKQFHLFEKMGKRCHIRDETIVQLAAVTELVFDYGWPRTQVVMESPPRGEATQGALDLLVFTDDSRSGPAVIGGEAKGSDASIQSFLKRVRSCKGVDPTHRDQRHSEHKKCIALREFRPRLFLAVAGGYRALFSLGHEGGRFLLSEVSINVPGPNGA